MKTKNNIEDFDLSKEIFRKIFHLLILLLPLGYQILGQNNFLKILIPITLITLFLDYFRHKNEVIKLIFNKIFSVILRPKEQEENSLSGASYTLIAAIIIFCLAKKEIAITSFLILAICDLTACLVGKSLPSKPFFEKTFAGSLSFYISGIILLFITGGFFNLSIGYYIFGFFAVFVSTIIEARPSLFKIDDNFLIPFSFALVMTMFDLIWKII